MLLLSSNFSYPNFLNCADILSLKVLSLSLFIFFFKRTATYRPTIQSKWENGNNSDSGTEKETVYFGNAGQLMIFNVRVTRTYVREDWLEKKGG